MCSFQANREYISFVLSLYHTVSINTYNVYTTRIRTTVGVQCIVMCQMWYWYTLYKKGDNRNWTPRRVPFMSVLLHPTIPLTHTVWSLRSHETCFSACTNTFCKYWNRYNILAGIHTVNLCLFSLIEIKIRVMCVSIR